MERKANQPLHNKALHPTAYSFGFALRSFLTPLQAYAFGGG